MAGRCGRLGGGRGGRRRRRPVRRGGRHGSCRRGRRGARSGTTAATVLPILATEAPARHSAAREGRRAAARCPSHVAPGSASPMYEWHFPSSRSDTHVAGGSSQSHPGRRARSQMLSGRESDDRDEPRPPTIGASTTRQRTAVTGTYTAAAARSHAPNAGSVARLVVGGALRGRHSVLAGNAGAERRANRADRRFRRRRRSVPMVRPVVRSRRERDSGRGRRRCRPRCPARTTVEG
jgi:hypothetical protein